MEAKKNLKLKNYTKDGKKKLSKLPKNALKTRKLHKNQVKSVAKFKNH